MFSVKVCPDVWFTGKTRLGFGRISLGNCKPLAHILHLGEISNELKQGVLGRSGLAVLALMYAIEY